MKQLATSVTVELTARDVHLLKVALGVAMLDFNTQSKVSEGFETLETLFEELSDNMVRSDIPGYDA